MRVLVACLALAAVIALPGVIVAARSNPSPSSLEYASGGPIVEISPPATVKAAPSPIDSALLPAMAVLSNAFATKGVGLSLLSHGFDYSHFEQVGKIRGNCPVDIWLIDTEKGSVSVHERCGTGDVVVGKAKIVYSPPSAGATVRQTVASLR